MKLHPIPVITLVVLILAACTSASTQIATPETVAATAESQPAATDVLPAEPGPATPASLPESPAALVYPDFTGAGLVFDRGTLFAGSGVCTGCHNIQTDATGRDVSLGRNWSATMMANAAKDPYWLATVRSEIELEPELRAVIEQKCATCHMPMAEVTALAAGEATLLLDEGFSAPAHPLHNLARDGVSCNLCHQVEGGNFGEAESFSGGFLIDLQAPSDSRLAYGPYTVGRQLVSIMQTSSGFIPQQGAQLSQSELCGTCHNLITPFVDANGEVAGEFAEQAIYSEWDNSAFVGVKGCMDCHMPVAGGGIQLSITGGPARTPFSQHIFTGSNAFMLNILRYFGEQIGVTTSSAALAQGVLAGLYPRLAALPEGITWPAFYGVAVLTGVGFTMSLFIGTLAFGSGPLSGSTLVTGGDISPLGNWILLRTYSSAYLWLRGAGDTVGEAMARDPCPLPAVSQSPQASGSRLPAQSYSTPPG